MSVKLTLDWVQELAAKLRLKPTESVLQEGLIQHLLGRGHAMTPLETSARFL